MYIIYITLAGYSYRRARHSRARGPRSLMVLPSYLHYLGGRDLERERTRERERERERSFLPTELNVNSVLNTDDLSSGFHNLTTNKQYTFTAINDAIMSQG